MDKLNLFDIRSTATSGSAVCMAKRI